MTVHKSGDHPGKKCLEHKPKDTRTNGAFLCFIPKFFDIDNRIDTRIDTVFKNKVGVTNLPDED